MNKCSEEYRSPTDLKESRAFVAGRVIWLTGLSGAGKTTLAQALHRRLLDEDTPAIVLDGDQLREGISKDLGYSEASRHEHIRRVAELAKLIANSGLLAIAATISPLRAMRQQARHIVGAHRFLEVHVSTPLSICEHRDVKGLYGKAREGLLPNFTGVSAPYEEPQTPCLRIDTAHTPLPEAVDLLLHHLRQFPDEAGPAALRLDSITPTGIQ